MLIARLACLEGEILAAMGYTVNRWARLDLAWLSRARLGAAWFG